MGQVQDMGIPTPLTQEEHSFSPALMYGAQS